MSKNILFITEQLFVERTGASNAIDGKQLFPMIKVAQDIYIQPTLGSTLYKRLQTGIDQDNLTNDEKLLIDDYVTDALIWYTMAMLPMTLGYQLFSKGFLQKTSEESQAPSHKDLELIEARYKSMAENYNTRMIKYLQQNYNLYYEYLNTTSGVDVIFPELKAYTCPIYIGDGVQRVGTFNSVGAYQQPYIAYYTATGGETNFNVALLVSRTPLLAFRGGLNKEIVETATNDTQQIQINNGLVTLPVGDVAMAGEIFTFSYR